MTIPYRIVLTSVYSYIRALQKRVQELEAREQQAVRHQCYQLAFVLTPSSRLSRPKANMPALVLAHMKMAGTSPKPSSSLFCHPFMPMVVMAYRDILVPPP